MSKKNGVCLQISGTPLRLVRKLSSVVDALAGHKCRSSALAVFIAAFGLERSGHIDLA